MLQNTRYKAKRYTALGELCMAGASFLQDFLVVSGGDDDA